MIIMMRADRTLLLLTIISKCLWNHTLWKNPGVVKNHEYFVGLKK